MPLKFKKDDNVVDYRGRAGYVVSVDKISGSKTVYEVYITNGGFYSYYYSNELTKDTPITIEDLL